MRKKLLLSQEAVGAQGFVSTPGWIKIENSQRLPSDQLISKLVKWLVQDKYLPAGDQERLRDELLMLKYLNHRSEFVRGLATLYQQTKAGAPVEIEGPSPEAAAARGRRGLKAAASAPPAAGAAASKARGRR